MTVENLSHLYEEKGDLEKALRLANRSLTLAESNLGPNAFRVAQPLRRVSALLKKQGKLEEAQKIDIRVIELLKKRYGEKDPKLLAAQKALGLTTSTASTNETTE